MLTVITGPMFAGKTTALLEIMSQSENAKLFKPKFDNRYSSTKVVSHDGLTCDSIVVDKWIDPQCSTYIFDEIQFFNSDIVDVVYNLMLDGKNIVVGGLNMDWMGKPFELTASMMAMADSIILLTGTCSKCHKPSTRTYKLLPDNKIVDLGGESLYDSRCLTHWREQCQNLKLK